MRSNLTSQQQNNSGQSTSGQLGILQPKGFPGLPPGWISEWETFPSSDQQVQLFAVNHRREASPGYRVLVVLHGMGEHGGRYFHLPHFLHQTVDAVYCLDHRGHGRSDGLRGHIERFDQFPSDTAHAIRRLDEQLKKRFGKSEIHVFAHSLGGLIGLRMLFLNPGLPIASATMASPLLGLKAKVPFVKKYAAPILSKVWGSIQLDTTLDPNTLSRDPEVIRAYQADRLVHPKMTPRFYTEMNSAMRDTLRRESGLTHPVMMMVPLNDGLVNSEVALRFCRNLKHRDKRLKTYPGFHHETQNEVGKEQVFEDLATWISEHPQVSMAATRVKDEADSE